jgi:chromosomal replication initiator protein
MMYNAGSPLDASPPHVEEPPVAQAFSSSVDAGPLAETAQQFVSSVSRFIDERNTPAPKASKGQANEAGLWLAVQEQLVQTLSPASFQTWIKPLRIAHVNLDEGGLVHVTLEAASDFTRGYVKNHYAPQIAQALKAVLGCERVALTWGLQAQPDVAPSSPKTLAMQQADANAEAILAQQDQHHQLQTSGTTQTWTPRTLTSGLQPRYTFEQFVVGPFNHFAHAAAVAIAEQPGIAYNPFFIHGSVGLGKTHLIQAIGHFVLRHHPNLNVRYVTTETFTNDLIHALTTRKMDAFREKYRKIDVLIIDDIQFLEGKDKTQEEMFHTFNALHSLGKQVILSSDRPPKALARLEERLISRFEWGLIVDIQLPDLEARKAILRKKAEREGMTLRFHLDEDVLTHLAELAPNNIRELEGNFNKLAATCMLEEHPFSMETVERLFGKPTNTKRLNEDMIIELVSLQFNVSVKDIKSVGRSKEVTHARQIATYLCRELLDLSFPRLGQVFNRKHSTMLYGYEKLKGQLGTNALLKKQLDDLTQACRNLCY